MVLSSFHGDAFKPNQICLHLSQTCLCGMAGSLVIYLCAKEGLVHVFIQLRSNRFDLTKRGTRFCCTQPLIQWIQDRVDLDQDHHEVHSLPANLHNFAHAHQAVMIPPCSGSKNSWKRSTYYTHNILYYIYIYIPLFLLICCKPNPGTPNPPNLQPPPPQKKTQPNG